VKRRRGPLNAKRQQTPIPDDEMLLLVKGILANINSEPIEGNKYFWSDLFEFLPQLSNPNFFTKESPKQEPQRASACLTAKFLAAKITGTGW
jgi:hypothetical protein